MKYHCDIVVCHSREDCDCLQSYLIAHRLMRVKNMLETWARNDYNVIIYLISETHGYEGWNNVEAHSLYDIYDGSSFIYDPRVDNCWSVDEFVYGERHRPTEASLIQFL